MITAKVFRCGNSQAVRLPKEYRLDADEVIINRIGNVIIMVPTGDPWKVFSEGIKEIGSDFPPNIKKIHHSERAVFK